MGIRPLSAPIPNLSPRFPDHTIPRLPLGESTGIEKGQTSRLPARLEKTSPESRPDRKSVSTRNSYNHYLIADILQWRGVLATRPRDARAVSLEQLRTKRPSPRLGAGC